MSYTWHYHTWSELSTLQQYQIMKIRQQVFIIEQKCFYLDADGIDLLGWHGFMCDEDDQIIAYARSYQHHHVYREKSALYTLEANLLDMLHQYGLDTWWIGRVLVLPSHRKQGVGYTLMNHLQDELIKKKARYLCLSAQAYLQSFYQKLGYYPISETYLDAEIKHVCMMQSTKIVQQQNMPKHIIFDFDGTLFNSRSFYLESFQKLADYLGEPPPSIQRLKENMHAGLIPQLATFLSHRLANELDSIVAAFRKICLTQVAHAKDLYPYIPLRLSQLKACGYQLHICTNSSQDLCIKHVKHLEIFKFFTMIVGGDHGLERKPDPDMLLHITHTLNVDVSECVLIGDSHIDIMAAHHIKMPIIAVSWGFTDATQLSAADHCLNHTQEIVTQFLPSSHIPNT